MKKFLLLFPALLLFALAALPVRAQSTSTDLPPAPQGHFSLIAQAAALPGGGQTVAGTIVGGTYAIKPTISLRNDNLIAPANSTKGFFGGAQWMPSNKFLANTGLKGVQPYVTASIGVDLITPNNQPSQQHIAFLIGGGLNYTPATGPTVNLFEARYARLPGLAMNTALISSGFTLNF